MKTNESAIEDIINLLMPFEFHDEISKMIQTLRKDAIEKNIDELCQIRTQLLNINKTPHFEYLNHHLLTANCNKALLILAPILNQEEVDPISLDTIHSNNEIYLTCGHRYDINFLVKSFELHPIFPRNPLTNEVLDTDDLFNIYNKSKKNNIDNQLHPELIHQIQIKRNSQQFIKFLNSQERDFLGHLLIMALKMKDYMFPIVLPLFLHYSWTTLDANYTYNKIKIPLNDQFYLFGANVVAMSFIDIFNQAFITNEKEAKNNSTQFIFDGIYFIFKNILLEYCVIIYSAMRYDEKQNQLFFFHLQSFLRIIYTYCIYQHIFYPKITFKIEEEIKKLLTLVSFYYFSGFIKTYLEKIYSFSFENPQIVHLYDNLYSIPNAIMVFTLIKHFLNEHEKYINYMSKTKPTLVNSFEKFRNFLHEAEQENSEFRP